MLKATREQRVHGQDGDPGQHGAGDEPGQGEKQGLRAERQQDGSATESEGAQRADLGRPARHRGVHGVQRAERGARAHDGGEREDQDVERVGALGLLVVVRRFGLHLEREAAVVLDAPLERSGVGSRRHRHAHPRVSLTPRVVLMSVTSAQSRCRRTCRRSRRCRPRSSASARTRSAGRAPPGSAVRRRRRPRPRRGWV